MSVFQESYHSDINAILDPNAILEMKVIPGNISKMCDSWSSERNTLKELILMLLFGYKQNKFCI